MMQKEYTEHSNEHERESSDLTHSSSPGQVLRQARENLGLSQLDISELLHLRIAVINELEQDHFDLDREDTFTRGYLKIYAKRVGVNPEEVSALFDQIRGRKQVTSSMHFNDIKSFSNRTLNEKKNRRIVWLSVFIVLLFSAFIFVYYMKQREDTTAISNVERNQQLEQAYDGSTEEPVVTGETPLTETIESTEIDTPEAIETDQSLNTVEPPALLNATSSAAEAENLAHSIATSLEDDSSILNTTSEIESTTTALQAESLSASETKPEAPVLKKGESRVILTFSDKCWLEITDANNKVLLNATKEKGDSIVIETSALPLKVLAGVPEAIKVTVNDANYNISKTLRGKRFSIQK